MFAKIFQKCLVETISTLQNTEIRGIECLKYQAKEKNRQKIMKENFGHTSFVAPLQLNMRILQLCPLPLWKQ